MESSKWEYKWIKGTLKMAEARYTKFYKPRTAAPPPAPAAPNHQSVSCLAAPLISLDQSSLQTSGSTLSRMLANVPETEF